MNEKVKSTIRYNLREAIREGTVFRKKAELIDYLVKSCGLREEVVRSDPDWLLEVYIEEKDDPGNRCLPSPSQSANSLPVGADVCLDEEETIEKVEFDLPQIISDKVLPTSIFLPRENLFKPASRKICKGSASYISREAAARHNLKVKGNRFCLVLWKEFGLGYHEPASRTRCRVVEQHVIPGCDLVFGDNCGSEDADFSEEELPRSGPSRELEHQVIPYPPVPMPPAVMASPGLAPAELEQVKQFTAQMNLFSSTSLVHQMRETAMPKRKAEDETNFTFRIDPAKKKARTLSDISSVEGDEGFEHPHS